MFSIKNWNIRLVGVGGGGRKLGPTSGCPVGTFFLGVGEIRAIIQKNIPNCAVRTVPVAGWREMCCSSLTVFRHRTSLNWEKEERLEAATSKQLGSIRLRRNGVHKIKASLRLASGWRAISRLDLTSVVDWVIEFQFISAIT
jgi:hypothetical protein